VRPPADTYISPNDSDTEEMMARLVRKILLDPATLKRAQAILGRRTESAAIREALVEVNHVPGKGLLG